MPRHPDTRPEIRVRFLRTAPGGDPGPASRTAARGLLSDLSGIDPERFQFGIEPGGRPVVRREPGVPDLRFSLAHADGVSVCAAAEGRDVGADVESLDRLGPNPLEAASELCSPAEFEALLHTPPDLVRERFLLLWTVKEAVAKATGLGLRLPLIRIRVFSGGPLRPAMAADPSSLEGAPCWCLSQMWPTPRHAAAVAVRAAPGERIRVRIDQGELVHRIGAEERGPRTPPVQPTGPTPSPVPVWPLP